MNTGVHCAHKNAHIGVLKSCLQDGSQFPNNDTTVLLNATEGRHVLVLTENLLCFSVGSAGKKASLKVEGNI